MTAGLSGLITTSEAAPRPMVGSVTLAQLMPPSLDLNRPWTVFPPTAAKTTLELAGLTAIAPNSALANRLPARNFQCRPPAAERRMPPLGPCAAAYRMPPRGPANSARLLPKMERLG